MDRHLPPFHLAFPVTDLDATRAFYGGLLGCPEGRSSERWIDFDFFGHQLVAHLVEASEPEATPPEPLAGGAPTNEVDGDRVPVPHFGAVLAWDTWRELADRLRAGGVRFRIEPRIRFRGQVGEQATMFFEDPSGNALEIKAFRNPEQLFAR